MKLIQFVSIAQQLDLSYLLILHVQSDRHQAILLSVLGDILFLRIKEALSGEVILNIVNEFGLTISHETQQTLQSYPELNYLHTGRVDNWTVAYQDLSAGVLVSHLPTRLLIPQN